MLQRAIYVSDAVGTAGASMLSIAQIVGVSVVNNRRDHLSGVLMHHRGQFMQLVEGARPDMDRLMARLTQDGRHENIRILHNGPAERRCFGAAPMAKVEIAGELEGLIGDRRLDELSVSELTAVYHAAATELELAA